MDLAIKVFMGVVNKVFVHVVFITTGDGCRKVLARTLIIYEALCIMHYTQCFFSLY